LHSELRSSRNFARCSTSLARSSAARSLHRAECSAQPCRGPCAISRRTTRRSSPRRSRRDRYLKPDGKLVFDKLSSCSCRARTREDQPVHLKLTDPSIFRFRRIYRCSTKPAQRYCPAGVYEVVRESGSDPRFRSTRRTACTARRATSRIRRRTLRGSRRKVARTKYSNM